MRERKGREYWIAVARRYEGSGLSQPAFCALHGLNIGTFRSWLYRLRNEEIKSKQQQKRKPTKRSAKFLEVACSPGGRAVLQSCLVRAGQVEVEFRETPAVEYLGELITCLQSPTK